MLSDSLVLFSIASRSSKRPMPFHPETQIAAHALAYNSAGSRSYLHPRRQLLALPLKIDTLYPIGHAGQDFVRDGAECLSQYRHRQIISKDDSLVPFLAINIRHINHAYIHADIANIGRLLPVHQAISVPVAQMPVQPVGISDRDSGNPRVAVQDSFPAITYSLIRRNIMYLQPEAASDFSPASFVLPYAPRGSTGLSSVYGIQPFPLKT